VTEEIEETEETEEEIEEEEDRSEDTASTTEEAEETPLTPVATILTLQVVAVSPEKDVPVVASTVNVTWLAEPPHQRPCLWPTCLSHWKTKACLNCSAATKW